MPPVFETKDRDEAHRKADELNGCTCADLAEPDTGCPLHGEELARHFRYECREDPNGSNPYQVWEWVEAPPSAPEGEG